MLRVLDIIVVFCDHTYQGYFKHGKQVYTLKFEFKTSGGNREYLSVEVVFANDMGFFCD